MIGHIGIGNEWMRPKVTMLLLSITLSTFSIPILAQTDTTEWTVLLGGNRAGFSKRWRNPDGGFSESFQYNDRGRGDSSFSTYRLDESGYLTYLEASGVDYLKKPSFERFRLGGGKATWSNNAERDSATVRGWADYVPLKIPVNMPFRHYLNAPDSSIRHLPSGSSKLEVLAEHVLPDGKKVRLVSVFGLALTPTYAWIDEQAELFANAGDWLAVIRKGYEDMNAVLLEAQRKFEGSYFGDLAGRLSHGYGPGMAIRNVKLFDAVTGKARRHATLLIAGGRILDVEYGRTRIPRDFLVIEGKGRFVMPGMWDMHVHYNSDVEGLQSIACGVTNVRDMGNGETLLDKKRDIDVGKVIGPRLQVLAGFIDGAGPYAGPVGARIESVAEGISAIRRYDSLGYRHIKLYSSIRPEWVRPMAEEAKRLGMRVSGHIPAHMTAVEAVEDGYDEIQHANMVFLNFYGKDLDTRTPLRFSVVAERAAGFDFESGSYRSLLRTLKENRVAVDPTVTVFEDMFQGREGVTSPSLVDIDDRFPLTLRRAFRSGSGLSIPPGMEETYRSSYASVLKLVKSLHDHGITLVPGTDGMAGFQLHREMINYSKAGIPNAEVLRIATLLSATVAGKTDGFGSIQKGKFADLVMIDGNPLRDMQDIRKVDLVVKDGTWYRSREVLEAIAIREWRR